MVLFVCSLKRKKKKNIILVSFLCHIFHIRNFNLLLYFTCTFRPGRAAISIIITCFPKYSTSDRSLSFEKQHINICALGDSCYTKLNRFGNSVKLFLSFLLISITIITKSLLIYVFILFGNKSENCFKSNQNIGNIEDKKPCLSDPFESLICMTTFIEKFMDIVSMLEFV